MHCKDRIEHLLSYTVKKLIFIQTEVFASECLLGIDFGRNLQLDKQSFLTIWNVSLVNLGSSNNSLMLMEKEAYNLFSNRFMLTP